MALLTPLCAQLDAAVTSVLEDGCRNAPPEFLAVISAAVEQGRGPMPGLLACAASRWCGSSPDAGLPVAVATVLLRSAILSHAGLPGFSGYFPGSSLGGRTGEADALLAGDALIPMAFGHLASAGGVHATLLVQDAVRTLGGEGILEGYSLELDLGAGAGRDISEEGSIWRVHAGKLARFASRGGARLAGASLQLLDDAARIGLCTGLAIEMIQGCACPSRRRLARGSSTAEVSMLLDEAIALVGNGPEGDVYRLLIASAWGEDLFRDVEPG
jgi:geranylgeranyl pyrophosphate synthase